MYYLEAASLVAYVDRAFGRDRLRALWPVGGFRDIENRLGVDAATLERRWRADIAQRTASASWPTIWRATQSKGCE